MVFKENWEKTQHQHPIADLLLQSIIYSQIEASLVKDYRLIDGGCANWNVQVVLISGESLLFRVYNRDAESAHLEQELYQYLNTYHIPVPNIQRIFTYESYIVAIVEYIEGRTLRDILLEYKNADQLHSQQAEKEIAGIMHNLGDILKQLRAIPTEGKISTFLKSYGGPNELENFVEEILADKNFQQVFPANIQSEIKEFLQAELHLLEEAEGASLVHGDYDPANILVSDAEGKWKISAILDWEFAHIGSPIWDIANMLRYKHFMPAVFEQEFLRGVYGVEMVIPSKLDKQISICNLISLLDCLKRTDIKKCPERVKDISELVRGIINDFE